MPNFIGQAHSRGSVIPYYPNFETKTNFGLLELKASFRESCVNPKTNDQRSQLISQTLKSAVGLCCRQDLRACLAGLYIFGLTESSYTTTIATRGFIVLYHNFPHTPWIYVNSSAFDHNAQGYDEGSKFPVIWSLRSRVSQITSHTCAIVARRCGIEWLWGKVRH